VGGWKLENTMTAAVIRHVVLEKSPTASRSRAAGGRVYFCRHRFGGGGDASGQRDALGGDVVLMGTGTPSRRVGSPFCQRSVEAWRPRVRFAELLFGILCIMSCAGVNGGLPRLCMLMMA